MKANFEGSYPLYFFVLLASWLAAGLAWTKKGVCRKFGLKPACNSALFDGAGPSCRAVKEGAKGWRALHTLYNGPFEHLADRFWLIGLKNPRAVRNRLRFVVAALHEELTRVLSQKESVTVLSLACGSAEAVFQAVAKLGAHKDRVRLILVDQDQTALDYAEAQAKKLGLRVEAHKSSVARLRRIVRGEKVDVIEMVGLMDYLDDGTATRLFETIYDSLQPRGMFITANVIPNPEVPFLRHCSDWEMIYRSDKELESLCAFIFNSETVVTVEPLGVHAIAVCRKD